MKRAAKLNEEGVRVERPKKHAKPPIPMPKDLAAALKKNSAARRSFDELPPGHRREYLEWITGAKRESTRARRVATAVEWLAEGKPLNWKYIAGRTPRR